MSVITLFQSEIKNKEKSRAFNFQLYPFNIFIHFLYDFCSAIVSPLGRAYDNSASTALLITFAKSVNVSSLGTVSIEDAVDISTDTPQL